MGLCCAKKMEEIPVIFLYSPSFLPRSKNDGDHNFKRNPILSVWGVIKEASGNREEWKKYGSRENGKKGTPPSPYMNSYKSLVYPKLWPCRTHPKKHKLWELNYHISPCPCPRLPLWCIQGAAKALEPLAQKASQVDRLLKENRKVYFPQNISITPGASQHNIWNCQGTIQNYLTNQWQGKSIQVKDRYKLWHDPDVVIIRKTLKQLL